MILLNQIPDKTSMKIEKVNENQVYAEFTVKAIIRTSDIQNLYDTLDADFIEIREMVDVEEDE